MFPLRAGTWLAPVPLPSSSSSDKNLITSSGTDSPAAVISAPAMAPAPLCLSAHPLTVLTAHIPVLISSVTTNFQEHRMQDKIAGTAGGFWVGMCPYLFAPSTVSIIMGACASCSWQLWRCWLWWAAPRRSWEPDLSCLQLTLISRLLQISLRGLIARKFMLTVLVLLFSLAFLAPALVHRLKTPGESLCFSWAWA